MSRMLCGRLLPAISESLTLEIFFPISVAASLSIYIPIYTYFYAYVYLYIYSHKLKADAFQYGFTRARS